MLQSESSFGPERNGTNRDKRYEVAERIGHGRENRRGEKKADVHPTRPSSIPCGFRVLSIKTRENQPCQSDAPIQYETPPIKQKTYGIQCNRHGTTLRLNCIPSQQCIQSAFMLVKVRYRNTYEQRPSWCYR